MHVASKQLSKYELDISLSINSVSPLFFFCSGVNIKPVKMLVFYFWGDLGRKNSFFYYVSLSSPAAIFFLHLMMIVFFYFSVLTLLVFAFIWFSW